MPTHWNFVLTFMFIYGRGVPEVVRVLSRLASWKEDGQQLVATSVPAPLPSRSVGTSGRRAKVGGRPWPQQLKRQP